jgi:tape measure domain-containing protein
MANIRLTANERAFVNSMDNAAGSVGRLSASLNIQLARAMRETDNITRNFAQGFGRLGDRISGVGQTLTSAFTLPIAVAAGAAAKFYGDIDQLKRALDVYGVSLNEIKQTAKLPGLGIEEAGKATINFLSVKYAADLSNRAVREFGNALVYSGRGKEDLAGIANAFAQMKGKGIISAEEVNQLAERLPMIRDLMQSAFGTSSTEAIQKLGITADEFLGKIVTQLEKLPRVSGGFKTAWENIIDSVKLGSYEVVNIADKLFGLTAILDGVSGYIDRAVKSFKELSPEIQTAIFVIGGIALAIGPILVLIGYLTTSVIPAFLVGLGYLSAPILGIAAIVAVVVANIIKYWDQIKSVLVNTGIWDGVASIFKYGLGILNSLVGVFYSLFTADWEGFWKNLKTIVARLWNGLVEILVTPFKALFELQRVIANQFNFEFLANSATKVIGWIDAIATDVKAKIPESTNYLKKLGDALNNVTNKPNIVVNKPAGNIPSKNAIGDLSLIDKFKGKTDLSGIVNPVFDFEGFNNFLSKTQKELDARAAEILDPFAEILKAGERLKNGLPKIMSGLNMSEAGMTIDEQIKKNIADKAMLAFYETQEMISRMATDLGQNVLPNALASVFESLGSGEGFAKGLGNAFKSILSTIGSYMIELGKKALVATALIEGLKKAFGTVAGPAAALAMIAGGGLLKGLANSLFSQTPKFANGGIVSGPTLGLMGEYAGARSNPEVIAPLSKLKDLLGGGGGSVIPDVKILGEDIYIAFNRYKKRTGNA